MVGRRRWRAFAVSALFACGLLVALRPASAQQVDDEDVGPTSRPTSAPVIDADAPNLVHGRHLRPYAASRPTVIDPTRILTDRPPVEGAPPLRLPKEEPSFTFAVLGDRTGGPAAGVNVLADAVRDVNLFGPDLVMCVGDMIQGYNTTPEWIPQAREHRAIVSRLLAPFLPTAGNHDVTWRALDKSIRGRPREEHEPEYERYVAPLYYAFEYRGSGFIVLYTDEGDPATGVKGALPRSQRFSERQLAWIKATLERFKGCDHVFMFAHYPRWIGGGADVDNGGDGPPDDRWGRIHAMAVDAGNVRMVFGGHIHRMRSDSRDGIDYLTLAVTGAGQGRAVPSVGNTDHFDLVTVRKDHCSVVAVPVGAAMDPREITGTVMREAGIVLSRQQPQVEGGPLRFAADGSVDQALKVTITNPTTRPVRVTFDADSRDSRWRLAGGFRDVELAPKASRVVDLRVRRKAGEIDDTCRPVELVVEQVYQMPTHDYPIPERRTTVPLDVAALPPVGQSLALALARSATLVAPPEAARSDGSSFTLEARFRARRVEGRQAIAGRFQRGGYALSVIDGRLVASVQTEDGPLAVTSDRPLEPGRWTSAAASYDGKTLRLYVDGRLAGEAAGGEFVDNPNPLGVGNNLALRGEVRRFEDRFEGDLDWLRLSRIARYREAAAPMPEGRATSDASTLLLLNFDRQMGAWTPDESPANRLFPLEGTPLAPIE